MIRKISKATKKPLDKAAIKKFISIFHTKITDKAMKRKVAKEVITKELFLKKSRTVNKINGAKQKTGR